jgi:hypothetical protein
MKSQILFVYEHEYPDLWQDGLFAALELLSYDFNITLHNLFYQSSPVGCSDYDFILGWGAFGSYVDKVMRTLKRPRGLCIAGNAVPPTNILDYDALFYETEWFRPQIENHPRIIHAFGTNTSIYKPRRSEKLWDCVTVGAFALWKRQNLMLSKSGLKLAIGEIQKGNAQESYAIISQLLSNGVMVSNMVSPETLAKIYNMSKLVYIPADINGGGERAVLEARACGVPVEVELDNPKLKELLSCDLYTEQYYAKQLKEGIELCL